MTDLTPKPPRGLSRRTLLRNGLVLGAGAAAASLAVPALTGVAVARADADLGAIQPGTGHIFRFTTQTNWWWCSYCSELFWSDSNGDPNGACAGHLITGIEQGFVPTHNSSGSGHYYMPHDSPPITDVQSQWSWCSKCDALFWGPYVHSSCCPGNLLSGAGGLYCGPHTRGSTVYDMLFGGWTTQAAMSISLQGSWTYCNACQGLYWGQLSGACPATLGQTTHSPGSHTDYQLFLAGPFGGV
jgi:hypothetical protein